MEALVGDTTLHYRLDGERGSLVVLTHGLGGTLAFWDPHVAALAAHHRVLRWDLRGAGGSAKPAGPYDPSLFARDLAGLLAHVGEPRAHLVGHSGGGVVSQRFALDFLDRTDSLVLVSTSSEVGEKARQAWHRVADVVERKGFGPEREPDARAFSPAFAAAHPEVVRDVARVTRAYSKGVWRFRTDQAFALTVLKKYLQVNETDVLTDTWTQFGKYLASPPYVLGFKNVLDEYTKKGKDVSKLKESDLVDTTAVKALDDAGFYKQLYGK